VGVAPQPVEDQRPGVILPDRLHQTDVRGKAAHPLAARGAGLQSRRVAALGCDMKALGVDVVTFWQPAKKGWKAAFPSAGLGP